MRTRPAARAKARVLIDTICEACGKTFRVDASRLKHGRGRTCSRTCQYVVIGRKNSAHGTGETRFDLVCHQCGRGFQLPARVFNWQTKIGKPPKYCSKICAHLSPEWKANLGASLRASPRAVAAQGRMLLAAHRSVRSEEGRRRGAEQVRRQQADPVTRRRWLDGIAKRQESQEWHNAVTRRGPDNPMWRGGTRLPRQQEHGRIEYKAWRHAVFTRDDYTCAKCGKRGGPLQAHHVKSWIRYPSLRYEPANGSTLCLRCHRRVHANPRQKIAGQLSLHLFRRGASEAA